MLAIEHTQSLTDFRLNAAETLDRLNKTGEAEIITVNGEARAILVSPAVYDELAREAEAASMRRSLKQHAAGESQGLQEVSSELRAMLLAMKAAHDAAGAK